ncbi:hypothetical protein ABIB28_003305 [Sphingomonas sp. UYEF23]
MRHAYGDAGDGVGEPRHGIDATELRGLDQAVDIGGAMAALVLAHEQPVLTTDPDAAQRAFRRVVVDFEPTILDVAGQYDQRVSA